MHFIFRYESCWPAILHKTDGIIFVYNENSSQQKSDLEIIYNYFIEQPGFSEKDCILMFNQFGNENNSKPSTNPLPSINHVGVNIEEKGAELRKTFNSFLSAIISRNANDLNEWLHELVDNCEVNCTFIDYRCIKKKDGYIIR